jgi:hypothetical protein
MKWLSTILQQLKQYAGFVERGEVFQTHTKQRFGGAPPC